MKVAVSLSLTVRCIRRGITIDMKRHYGFQEQMGYQVYYLWVMAGNSGRTLTPSDDPKHAWIKAVENMV